MEVVFKSQSAVWKDLQSNIVGSQDSLFFVKDKVLVQVNRHTLEKVDNVEQVIFHSSHNSVLFVRDNLLTVNNESDYPSQVK